ncbi:SDR family NAD(P)-dependent oxidoreductase [Demequina salsinemoris]|uniref:SDR family NAD(P)-dependent oxidoreductase n=1 Tax=Demequina salsinemoris TaxID=577470 RepID=UPI0007836488|nr:SDR family oxidoreductase [Demequina salsinemoris]
MHAVPSCVVVTGASSGFGAEFARRFAQRGADVVLVARRRDRLEELASQLQDSGRVRAYPIAVDLAKPGAVDDLMDELAVRGLRPDGLVNCAGFGIDGPFADADPARVTSLVQVNVTALTELTHRLLPSILASGSGVLVNVASTAAFQPIPQIALYAASKAYVRTLTEAIWQEAKGSGARILALCPGPSRTEFFAAAGSERFNVGQMVSTDEVVDAAFDALAHQGAGPTRIVGWRNAVQAHLPRIVPTRAALAVTAGLTKD